MSQRFGKKTLLKKVLFEQNLLVVRLIICLSILITLAQLFSPITLNCQLMLIQLVLFPHLAVSFFLWKIQIHDNKEKLKVGSKVGAITVSFSIILFLIIEMIRFLSPDYREPFFVERGVPIPDDDVLVSIAFTGAIIFISILMGIIGALSGFIAALFPIKYWLNRFDR